MSANALSKQLVLWIFQCIFEISNRTLSIILLGLVEAKTVKEPVRCLLSMPSGQLFDFKEQ